MATYRFTQLVLLFGLLAVAAPAIALSSWASASSLGESDLFIPIVQRGVPSQTPTATATLTPTPVPTHPTELRLYGVVYDLTQGPSGGVGGASVSLLLCSSAGGRRFVATAGPDGGYALPVPAMYLDACGVVTLEVWAQGYAPGIQRIVTADLYAQPERNVALTPISATQTLPWEVTPTPTATPDPAALVLRGKVYDADEGPAGGILGAVVQVTVCEPYDPIMVITAADGSYYLAVPSTHIADCPEVNIDVVAMGYESYSVRITVAELRAQPHRDYAMREESAAGGALFPQGDRP